MFSALNPDCRSYGEVATEEELESFVKEEMNLQTQVLWFLWCEPLKVCCWACFRDLKRRIYRSCRKPPPPPSNPQEVDSSHSNPSSSHPLMPTPFPAAGGSPTHSKDEEAQSPESTASFIPSQLRTLLSPGLGLLKSPSPTERPSPLPSPATRSPPLPPQVSKEDPLLTSHNYKTLFQSSSSQRLQGPQPTPSSSSSSTGLELMRATPAPHTNDSLRPLKSSLSDLYGSHSSRLYGRPSEANADTDNPK
jgi:hypothetical protein